MSFYRYKINTRFLNITGGTIQPMVNPITGNQSFDKYLPIRYRKSGPNNKLTTLSVRDSIVEDRVPFFNARRNDAINDSGLNGVKNLNTEQYISTGDTINPLTNYKNLILPIEVEFDVVDYGDDIQNFVTKEQQKAINDIVDGERVKYINEGYPNTVKINFRFYDKDNSVFDNTILDGGYNLAGFTNDEINKKNNFKKSYFRLYFFDSNDSKSQNLLTTEDIDVFNSEKPTFTLNRIYWLKNDELFNETINNRTVYMEARFFNAKTGRVHRFMNTPNSVSSPININTFSGNLEWKSSQLLILNPKTNNNNRYFRILPGVGANTTSEITLTEYILQT